jgi:hypothetical protein
MLSQSKAGEAEGGIMAERRRNMRAEACRSCGAACAAGAGYLYRDLGTGRRRASWFVKCEECHGGKKTRLSVKLERQAAARAELPAEPAVRPWGVASARKWAVELAPGEGGDVALFLAGPFGRLAISYRDRIGGGFDAPTGYALEEGVRVAGKPLSRAAALELSPRILALVAQVRERERAGVMEAAATLEAGGVVAVKHPFSDYWTVKLGGLVTLGAGPYQALAIDLSLAGDYFQGGRLTGYDRRSGVSLPVSWTAAELLAVAATLAPAQAPAAPAA